MTASSSPPPHPPAPCLPFPHPPHSPNGPVHARLRAGAASPSFFFFPFELLLSARPARGASSLACCKWPAEPHAVDSVPPLLTRLGRHRRAPSISRPPGPHPSPAPHGPTRRRGQDRQAKIEALLFLQRPWVGFNRRRARRRPHTAPLPAAPSPTQPPASTRAPSAARPARTHGARRQLPATTPRRRWPQSRRQRHTRGVPPPSAGTRRGRVPPPWRALRRRRPSPSRVGRPADGTPACCRRPAGRGRGRPPAAAAADTSLARGATPGGASSHPVGAPAPAPPAPTTAPPHARGRAAAAARVGGLRVARAVPARQPADGPATGVDAGAARKCPPRCNVPSLWCSYPFPSRPVPGRAPHEASG